MSARRAFTLIELLIVIAIIAILAAILFPVFGRVREQTRQTSCMSNMHQIYVGYSLYKQDHNKPPCLLLGIAERTPDHYPWQPGDGLDKVSPASAVQANFLYPAYIKNIETFHCPDNPDNDMRKPAEADYPAASPKGSLLGQVLNGHT
jgi:prepilin-type N-terminal cleavage/methylation domain-containing protein